MSDRNPWDDVPHLWDNEAAYLAWLRGQMRRTWSRHPVKTEYKRRRRYKAPVGKTTKKNPDGLVWVSDCEMCGKQSRRCQVDHITPAGSFADKQEFADWVWRLLFVTFDDLRELCKDCHEVVTHADKIGSSLDYAAKDKERIRFFKENTVKQQKEYLLSLGFSENDVTNGDKRQACYRKYFGLEEG